MFETIGYFLEYSCNGKYLGTKVIDKPLNREIGYSNRKTEALKKDIVLDNKKKIKKGTEVKSILYPLNGKIKK